MADVSPEMARAGVEFSAQEHDDQAKLDKKVEAMDGAASAGTAPAAAEATPPAAVLPDESTLNLCKGLVQIADRLVVGFTIPELKLTEAEVTQIGVAAVPVLNKHLPEMLQKLASTVEGQCVLTIAMIYASKAPGIFMAPPKPAAPVKRGEGVATLVEPVAEVKA